MRLPGVTRLASGDAGQKIHVTSIAEIYRQVRSTFAGEGGNYQGTSLYSLDVDLLASLNSDVILAQDLCYVCSIDLTPSSASHRT